MTAVWRVKEAYSYDDPNGVPVVVRAGDLLTADDPRAKGRERHLEQAEEAAARTTTPQAVETATAAPGERRSVTKTAGRTREQR